MDYCGVIIEESLESASVLKKLKIISTKLEQVTERHKTPWIKQWTLHAVEIPEGKAPEIAQKLSKALDRRHAWYADYETEKDHYIIFRDKIFHITDRTSKAQYDKAKEYGISLGIPDYQVDFMPYVQKWER